MRGRTSPVSDREVYGKYQLLARIASGGMAEVLLARSSSVGGFEKILAIKRMHPRLGMNQGFVSLFIEEAKLSVSLTHPNIVQVFDFGRVDDDYYIAMEYVEGVDLSTLSARARDRGHPLAPAACVYMMKCMFDGMAYAHNKRDRLGRPAGIIHRDISPHNVLVSFEGQVKISDFGIAKAVEEIKRSEKGEVVGKVAYMAPEQARGEVITTASDIWGGGVILHEILTNSRLFARNADPDTLAAVANLTIPPPSMINPMVPPALDNLVMRTLDRSVATRPSSAREVAEALDDVLRNHFPRMNEFKLTEVIVDIFDGEVPSLLAALEQPSFRPAPTARVSPFESTVAGTAAGEHSVPGATRSERPDLLDGAPIESTPSQYEPTTTSPRAPVIDEAVREPSADENWFPDPFSRGLSETKKRLVPETDTGEFVSVQEVERLKALFVTDPNLWVLVDIGDAYEQAGLPDRAMAAYELAAAKFAQQGLLVQAVVIYRMLVQRNGETQRVLEGIRRLQTLPGLSDAEMLLEIFTPGASDFSEYRGLFESSPPDNQVDIFAPAPIFSALGADQLQHLVPKLELRRVAPSTEIIREGEPGDSFFWVGRGRVVVSTTNFKGRRIYLTSLADGDCFGEQSFFTGKPRDATVETTDEALLVEVSKDALDQLIAQFPPVDDTLRQFYKDRIAESLLARSSLFGRLSVRDRRALATRFTFVNFQAGDTILAEGDDSDAFYAVKAGQVRVVTGPQEVELAKLAVGEVFGEIAALKGIARTASVRAISDCELLRLEADDLIKFLAQNPEIKVLIEQQIQDRADDAARKITGDW